MLVLDHIEAFDAPSRPRAATTEISRSNRHEAFDDRCAVRRARRTASGIGAIADHDLALAVVAEAAGLSTAGFPTMSIAATARRAVDARDLPFRCRAR